MRRVVAAISRAPISGTSSEMSASVNSRRISRSVCRVCGMPVCILCAPQCSLWLKAFSKHSTTENTEEHRGQHRVFSNILQGLKSSEEQAPLYLRFGHCNFALH